MKLLKSVSYTTVTVITLLYLSSCNFNRTYTPEFNGKRDAVLAGIDTKYRFENINIQGRKTVGTGGIHTSLIIAFLNGKNVPVEGNKIAALAEQLVFQIRQTLKNPKEYESYLVKFDTKVEDGNNSTTNSVSVEFKNQ